MSFEDFNKQEKKLTLEEIKEIVAKNASRVATLGQWPAYISPESLVERIPKNKVDKAPGFDAGLACALDLIPRDKQELSAKLHANYSKEAVMQIRQEIAQANADSQTMWWLSACSVCNEGEIDQDKFFQQIEDFKKLSKNKEERFSQAMAEYAKMTASFVLQDGVPFGTKDGCIQGAYIAGFPFGTQFADNFGIYFIGTFEESLGLEDFPWSKEKDDQGRDKSGPVFGSRQFVKCANKQEFERAVAIVKRKLML